MIGRRLISESYRRLNAKLHAANPNYGTTAKLHIDEIRSIAKKYNASSILDYGCGKQEVRNHLGGEFSIQCYDPAIDGLDSSPAPAEIVVCIDVLEHVEREHLETVLADIAGLVKRIGLLTIATQPAGKCLADGSNCHRIIEDHEWWIDSLARHFRLIAAERRRGSALWCLVGPLSRNHAQESDS